jgi:metal-responsive CopG/Arc/MetJ family transcriptional regulator
VILKTSVYLDPDVLVTIDRLARSQGRSRAEVIREAVRAYTGIGDNAKLPGIGKVKSGSSVTSNQ